MLCIATTLPYYALASHYLTVPPLHFVLPYLALLCFTHAMRCAALLVHCVILLCRTSPLRCAVLRYLAVALRYRAMPLHSLPCYALLLHASLTVAGYYVALLYPCHHDPVRYNAAAVRYLYVTTLHFTFALPSFDVLLLRPAVLSLHLASAIRYLAAPCLCNTLLHGTVLSLVYISQGKIKLPIAPISKLT